MMARNLSDKVIKIKNLLVNRIELRIRDDEDKLTQIRSLIVDKIEQFESQLLQKIKILEAMNPEKVLRQGYAILSGKVSPGSVVKITTHDKEINAEIKEIHDRS